MDRSSSTLVLFTFVMCWASCTSWLAPSTGSAKDPAIIDAPVLPTVTANELGTFVETFIPAVLTNVEWPGATVVEQNQRIQLRLNWEYTEPVTHPIAGHWGLIDQQGEHLGTVLCSDYVLPAASPGTRTVTVELTVPQDQLPGRYELRLLLVDGPVAPDGWGAACVIREIHVLARLHHSGAAVDDIATHYGHRAIPLGLSTTLSGESAVRVTVPAKQGQTFILLSNLREGHSLSQGSPVAIIRSRCREQHCADLILRAGVHTGAADATRPARHRRPELAWTDETGEAVWQAAINSDCLTNCQEWIISAAPGAAFRLIDIVALGDEQ